MIKNIELAGGVQIPQIGLGVAGIQPENTARMVVSAVEAGYRLIDTATIYKNEAEVGDGIAAGGVPREALCITTKVWPDMYGYDRVKASFELSLASMRLKTLDIFMLHWPSPAMDLYVESWQAIVDLQAEGRVKSIGVSNFFPEQLQKLKDETGVMPAINQLELHPYSQRKREVAFHAENGIATECWSPLGRSRCLEDPVLLGIASKHGCTTAQVVLRWHYEASRVAIPRSNSPERVRENLDILGFSLDVEDHSAIASLDKGLDGKLGPDPEIAG